MYSILHEKEREMCITVDITSAADIRSGHFSLCVLSLPLTPIFVFYFLHVAELVQDWLI